MDTAIGILVGSIISAFVVRMALGDFFERAKLRKAIARGEALPAEADDTVPGPLSGLGLTTPFRLGDKVGGRGVIGGVHVEGILEHVAGGDNFVAYYLLTVGLAGIQLTSEGVRRPKVDIATGDMQLDGLFIIAGPLEEVATRLDAGARRALLAAVAEGWRGQGDRLVRTGLAGSALDDALNVGVKAAAALQPVHAASRLAQTATHDPVLRMRRRALLVLLQRHASSPSTQETREALKNDQDPVIRWLLLRPAATAAPEATDDGWVRMSFNLLMDPTKAIEVAEALIELGATEALPAIGRALAAADDPDVKETLVRARSQLAGLVAARGDGRGGLALSDVEAARAGGLALDE